MRGGTPGEAAPQEAAVLRALHGALALIHLQLEATAEAPTPTGHHPFTSPKATHIDVAIIGVAAEPMPSGLKLLIQLVQHHIGKER